MAIPNASSHTVRGACGHDCPDTCGWVVEVSGGDATRLIGDRTHPFTRGTLCAKVNHYLDRVYHPDRVLHPLKRVGAKGAGRFERVTWDEALADIAARWRQIADESGAEAILPYSSAGVQGLIQMHSLDRCLFGSMGCSGLDRNICGAVAAAGLTSTVWPDSPNTAAPVLPTTVLGTAALACNAFAAAISQSRIVAGLPSPFWSPPQPAATLPWVEPDTSST